MKASATFQMPITNGRKRKVKMVSRKQKLGIVENGEGKQKTIPISNRAKGLEQIF